MYFGRTTIIPKGFYLLLKSNKSFSACSDLKIKVYKYSIFNKISIGNIKPVFQTNIKSELLMYLDLCNVRLNLKYSVRYNDLDLEFYPELFKDIYLNTRISLIQKEN